MRRLAWLSFSLFATACFSDTFSAAGETDGCEPGELGCDCHSNQTCNDDLVCNESVLHCVREDCVLGELLCPCDAGQCAAGLTCDGGLCTGDGSGMTSSMSGSSFGSTTTSSTDHTSSADSTSSVDSTSSTDPTTTSTTSVSSTSGDVGPPVTLYFTAAGFGLAEPGDGRTRADQTCSGGAETLGCSQALAVVSAAAGDTIAQLSIPPSSVLLNGLGGVVAPDFATFLEDGPANRIGLEEAGVRREDGSAPPLQFATGSDALGGLGPNCANWTMPVGEAGIGFSNVSGTGWLDGGSNGPFTVDCMPGASLPLLCACWTE